MDTNEIMNSEEVIETTTEIAKSNSGKGVMIAASVSIAVVVGVVAYRYAVKPTIEKIRAKKGSEAKIVMDRNVEVVK